MSARVAIVAIATRGAPAADLRWDTVMFCPPCCRSQDTCARACGGNDHALALFPASRNSQRFSARSGKRSYCFLKGLRGE